MFSTSSKVIITRLFISIFLLTTLNTGLYFLRSSFFRSFSSRCKSSFLSLSPFLIVQATPTRVNNPPYNAATIVVIISRKLLSTVTTPFISTCFPGIIYIKYIVNAIPTTKSCKSPTLCKASFFVLERNDIVKL